MRQSLTSALIVLVTLTGGVSGCANGSSESGGDPLERFNRGSYALSEAVDRGVLKPVSRGYNFLLPQPVRTGVRNFFDNLGSIDSSVNGFLQGKPRRGFTDAGRVVLNTTLGLGGLFDVATDLGLEDQDEDFGQTLAVWGYRNSAYVYLPVVGPLTVRDLPTVVLRFAWPRVLLGEHYNVATGSVDVVSLRAAALTLTDARDVAALDPYVFTREAYRQRRAFQISDGEVSAEDMFDEFEDDEFEEDGLDDPTAVRAMNESGAPGPLRSVRQTDG